MKIIKNEGKNKVVNLWPRVNKIIDIHVQISL